MSELKLFKVLYFILYLKIRKQMNEWTEMNLGVNWSSISFNTSITLCIDWNKRFFAKNFIMFFELKFEKIWRL